MVGKATVQEKVPQSLQPPQPHYTCPRCGYAFGLTMREGDTFTCPSCRMHLVYMIDENSGTEFFIDGRPARAVEPLGLPRGSVRAIVAMALSAACWTLVLLGRPVPDYLLGLLLATVGFYFGFRSRSTNAGGRIYDAKAQKEEPLNLPAGFIRAFLVIGFVLAALLLAGRGLLLAPAYLPLLATVLGLLVGHLFGRGLGRLPAGRLRAAIDHAKGLLVLAAALLLAVAVLAIPEPPQLPLTALCAVVSFYFGSRS